MKVLLTGFEPFGGETINPAYEAIKLLPQQIGGAAIVKKEIPVVFDEGAEVVLQTIRTEKPDIVISVGQAGGRTGITPEFVGINYQDARIPDNAGNQPLSHRIKEDGENAYFSLLPVKAMVTAMKEAGIASSVSYSAGTYVCNDVMFQLLYAVQKEFPGVRAGFIHVPFMTEQVADKPQVPALPLETISKGLALCVEAAIRHPQDIQQIGGTIQ